MLRYLMPWVQRSPRQEGTSASETLIEPVDIRMAGENLGGQVLEDS